MLGSWVSIEQLFPLARLVCSCERQELVQELGLVEPRVAHRRLHDNGVDGGRAPRMEQLLALQQGASRVQVRALGPCGLSKAADNVFLQLLELVGIQRCISLCCNRLDEGSGGLVSGGDPVEHRAKAAPEVARNGPSVATAPVMSLGNWPVILLYAMMRGSVMGLGLVTLPAPQTWVREAPPPQRPAWHWERQPPSVEGRTY